MKKTTIVHIILIIAILAVAGTAVYRLYRWNQGTTSNVEADIEQVDPSEFDVETLDMIIPLDSSRLEGHEDDGELEILCLGNNPFSDDRTEGGLAGLIASKTGAKVYNGSFPNSSTALRYYPMTPEYLWDQFNLPSIANALLAKEFKPMHSAVGYMEEGTEIYNDSIATLESVNMETIDAIIIMYDSHDYNIGTPCVNVDVPNDVQAFTGGLTFFLDIVKQYWPHIRVFVMTPTYAQYVDENGKLLSGDTTDLGNGTLPFYVQNEIDATVSCGYSVIDNYYGTINADNYEEYMSDNKNYNQAGREKLADRISEIINTKMSTVSSTK